MNEVIISDKEKIVIFLARKTVNNWQHGDCLADISLFTDIPVYRCRAALKEMRKEKIVDLWNMSWGWIYVLKVDVCINEPVEGEFTIYLPKPKTVEGEHYITCNSAYGALKKHANAEITQCNINKCWCKEDPIAQGVN